MVGAVGPVETTPHARLEANRNSLDKCVLFDTTLDTE